MPLPDPNNENENQVRGSQQNLNTDEWQVHHCDLCKRRFSNGEYLKIHKDVSHSNELGNVCKVCNKEFRASRALEEHMKYHVKRNSKKYFCEICNVSFSNSRQLQVYRKGFQND